MSNSQLLNSLLLDVTISSKHLLLFICDLSDLTLQIIFDAWWASMNVGSKHSIVWNSSRHAPLWGFYLDCGIKKTASPGIIWIICHQVLRHPSEYGTSSMGQRLLANVLIAKLTELIESEVSELTSTMVDGTALAILKKHGRRGITIVSSEMIFIFDTSIFSILIQWMA